MLMFVSTFLTGYEIMLTFCQTDMGGVTNETELLSPADVGVCQSRRYAVNSSTLFFVLDDDVLPDYEHNLTFTVSHTLSLVWYKAVGSGPKDEILLQGWSMNAVMLLNLCQ